VSKKPTPVSDAVVSEAIPPEIHSESVDLEKPVIKQAIAVGSQIIAEGKTKADAARAMYELISAEDKGVIVAAFVAGATLTEKGALTYWYNCKRKASKNHAK
jgi:hypothetical protein